MEKALSPIVIRSTGYYAPQRRLTNDDLSRIVETSDEWIVERTGIRERRIAADNETTADMAYMAALNALENAKLKPEDIDLLIVATFTPDYKTPSVACLVQHRLGLRTIPAFDISAACSGFVYSMEICGQLMRGGLYRNALVIGAEKLSSVTDWTDRTTCVLFGDAAGACVLSKTDEPGVGLIGNILGSDGGHPDILIVPGGGCRNPLNKDNIDEHTQTIKMNGREVFKLAVRVMEEVARNLLERHNLKPSDVNVLIPHQANTRIIDAITKRLEVPADRVVLNIDKMGNTSSASIPVALAQANEAGRIKSGDYVLLLAFGAGLTWGASLIKWR